MEINCLKGNNPINFIFFRQDHPFINNFKYPKSRVVNRMKKKTKLIRLFRFWQQAIATQCITYLPFPLDSFHNLSTFPLDNFNNFPLDIFHNLSTLPLDILSLIHPSFRHFHNLSTLLRNLS